MKLLWKLFLSCFIFFIITSLYLSCQKEVDKPAGQQFLEIYLTDDPVPYDAVYVNIQMVEVKVVPDNCQSREDEDEDSDDDHDSGNHDDSDDDDEDDEFHCAVWDTLNINPGVYNLLTLSNGVDTLLASGYTPSGRIIKIRITLGDNNSVVIDNVTYPLQLYDNRHRVIIYVDHEDDVEEIRPGNLQMFLDFDASRSIIRIENNRFVLRPRIELFIPSRTASIEGRVMPEQARAVIAAYTSTDTLVAIPHEDGEFKIRGLRGNSADLFINATANGYRDTTITGIAINPGHETDIGTIRLRQ